MVRKNTIKIFLLVIVTAAVTAILLSPWLSRERFQSRTPTVDTVIDVDTFTKIDTVKIPHTILVPSKTDTVYQERITKDTTLQVTRKTYDIDNDSVGAHVVVSGVNPMVDSLSIWSKKTSYSVNKTIIKTIPMKDTKRFKIYPTVGVGYGVFGRKLDMYIGVGFTYNIK